MHAHKEMHMPQLQLNDDFAPARPGQIAYNNQSAEDMPTAIMAPGASCGAGVPLFEVTAGAEDGQGRSIVSATGTGAFVGISVYTGTKMPSGYGGPSSILYTERDVVPIMRTGKIWVALFGAAVIKGAQLSAGTAGNLGKLTGGTGTLIPVKAYAASRSNNTLCVAEVYLPVPPTAVVAAQDAAG